MIETILELLPNTKSKSEAVQIAKGKYYLPQNLSEFAQQIKRIWLQRK